MSYRPFRVKIKSKFIIKENVFSYEKMIKRDIMQLYHKNDDDLKMIDEICFLNLIKARWVK